MNQGNTKIFILILISTLILTPIQSVFACNMLADHHGKSLLNITLATETPQASQHPEQQKAQHDQHCATKAHCLGDHCGQIVLFINIENFKTAPLQHAFVAQSTLNHPQLVITELHRPPILLSKVS